MKKKIIIFGATGNTGSFLADYAFKYFDLSKYEIILSGLRQTSFFNKSGASYYSVNIIDSLDFDKLPTENIHAVILLSAVIPSYMNEYDPQRYIDSIIHGAYNVLEFCRKNRVDRIIYTQTVFDISLYPSDLVLKPDIARNFSYKGDHAMYVIAKNTAIEFINHYFYEYGLKRFIFRLPTIYSYSPYYFYFPNGIKTMRPIYQMINKAMRSDVIEIWGDPTYSKDMVYVDDFSQMICKSVEVNRNEGFYNVGTGVPISLSEQVQTIIDTFSPHEKPSKIVYMPERISGGGFLMDISNAKTELGYEPVFSCKDLFSSFKNEMLLNRFQELRIVAKN